MSNKVINNDIVLSVSDLVISFKTDRGIVHAVRGVSFDLHKGETLCIVGESGSGKSVTNKAIMGISAANAIIENGKILYEGEDLIRVSEEEFHRIRGHKIGMIFQDPLSALNPTMRVGKQITEATLINKNILKRHYEDLYAPELTALRNVEADAEFEIKKCEDQIDKNSLQMKEFVKLNKKVEVYSKKINKLGIKEDDKTKKRLEFFVNKKGKYSKEFEELKNDINSYFSGVKRNIDEDIEKCQDVVSSMSKDVDENSGYNSLLVDIKNNKKERYESRLAFYRNLKTKDYKSENTLVLLKQRNKDLAELIRLFKIGTKKSRPALKKNLLVAKKKAKIETDMYYAKLKEIHEKKSDEYRKEITKINLEIEVLRGSLDENEKSKIDTVLRENEKKKKIIEKQLDKFKENSVSKTSSNDELVIKKTGNTKYDSLLEKRESVEIELQKEKDDFINKTHVTKAEAKKMALKVMREVGIPLPERRFKQYPFEFSGGMRQRIVIAIALTANPDILICDEPTTALDVTIQAQILELINKLKVERNLSCIFITHDLGVVANMADRVAVMYAGKIVEYGLANEVFFDPKHPYTWALLSSIPDVDSKEKLEAIPGTPPDMIFPPKGDAFALRSKYAMTIDFKYEPPYFKVSDTHYAATWLLYPGAPKVEMPQIVKTRIENALKGQKKEAVKHE